MFRTPQVILFSEDVTRAAAFYARLGFTETFRVPAEGEPIHVDLTLDDAGAQSAIMSTRLRPIAREHAWRNKVLKRLVAAHDTR